MYHPILRVLQRIIGIMLLGVGLVGLFIPFVPIWMLLIPGIALLGHNDPMVRSLHLTALRLIKSGKHHKSPWVRKLGDMTYAAYRQMRQFAVTLIERWRRYTSKRPPKI